MLQWSKWFQLDDRPGAISERPKIKFDSMTETFTITSKAGIPWVGFMTAMHDVASYKEFEQRPTEVALTLKEVNELLGDQSLKRLTTSDADGNLHGLNVPQNKK